jgi:NH3-dependent NAD+ synthetase
MAYSELDEVLWCLADRKLSLAQAVKETGVSLEKVKSVEKRMKAAAHKLAYPPVCKV